MRNAQCAETGKAGNSWTLTGLFLSSLVGAGFATGREIFIYFAYFGWPGIAGLLGACLLLFWAAFRILVVVGAGRMDRIGQLPRFVAGTRLATFFTGAIMLFSFCGYITMLVGFRHIMQQVFPPFNNTHRMLTAILSVGIATAFCLLILYRGFQRFARLCRVLTPVMIAAIALTALFFAFRENNPETVYQASAFTPSAFILRFLLYVGYNLLFIVSVLGRAGTMVSDSGAAFRGSLLGTALFLLGGGSIFVTLLRMKREAAQSDMPLLTMMQSLGEGAGTTFSCVLAGAMLLCAAPGLSATANAISEILQQRDKTGRYAPGKSSPEALIGTVLAVLAIPLSFIGFDTIVTVVYPLFGFVGIFLLAVLAQTRSKNV